MSVQVIKNFIDKDSCQRIIELLDKHAKETPRWAVSSALGWNMPTDAAELTFTKKIKPDTELEDVNTAYSKSLSEMSKFFGVEDLCLVNGFYQVLDRGAIHEIHCDSCSIDGTPLNPDVEEPNEWSAVLYLNDHGEDFTGGAVIFPEEDFSYLPEAGTFIYFPADVHHPHGVEEVISGSRKCLVIFAGSREKVLRSTQAFSAR
jgi:hypothetical protein